MVRAGIDLHVVVEAGRLGLGDEGRDRLDGEAGDDFIDGGVGADYVKGGTGDDLLNAGSDDEVDRLCGNGGDDTFWADWGGDDQCNGGGWLFGGKDNINGCTDETASSGDCDKGAYDDW